MRPDEELISYPANSREHRLWLQREREAATKPAVVQMSAHERAHWERVEQEKRWRENERRDREAIAQANRDRARRNEEIIKQRAADEKAKKAAVVAEMMIRSVFDSYGCTAEERRRITQLVMNRTPHLKNDPNAYEVKILQYRGAMETV